MNRPSEPRERRTLTLIEEQNEVRGPLSIDLRVYTDEVERPCEAVVLDAEGRVVERFTPTIDAVVGEAAEADVLAQAESFVARLESFRSRGLEALCASALVHPHTEVLQVIPERSPPPEETLYIGPGLAEYFTIIALVAMTLILLLMWFAPEIEALFPKHGS